jgi:hypothetical protein
LLVAKQGNIVMKALKKTVLFLLFLAAVLAVVSVFLPANYHVERSIVVMAKSEEVYPYLNNLKRWQDWSAWTKEQDPTVVFTYEGPEEGVGSTMKWTGKKFRDGTLTITESNPQIAVKYDLSLRDGDFTSHGAILFKMAGPGTKLVWVSDGDLSSNPIHRYAGLIMERMIGKDFEIGLRKLKKKIETAK